MTEIPPEVLQLGVQLSESMARNGSSMVLEKIRALRASGRHEDTVAALEEIINELQEDKRQLVSIAQAYQSQLVSQQLASGDIKYIAETLFPLIEQLMGATSEDGTEDGTDEEEDPKTQELLRQLRLMKPLLSVETANVLQLLGFNFRRAIGEPLTSLCEKMILSKVDRPDSLPAEIQLAAIRNQTALAGIASDPEAYERFRSLIG